VGPKNKPSWWAEKESVTKLFQSRCYVCHRKFGKRFTFHHKFYEQDKTFYTDKDYHARLYKEIRKNPSKFLLVCNRHHYAIENLKKYSKDVLERLIRATKMSRY